MASSTTMLDPSAVLDGAALVDRTRDDIDSAIDMMARSVNHLMGSWTGSTAEKFGTMASQWAAEAQDWVAQLDSLAGGMRGATAAVSGAAQDGARRLAAIGPAGLSPSSAAYHAARLG